MATVVLPAWLCGIHAIRFHVTLAVFWVNLIVCRSLPLNPKLSDWYLFATHVNYNFTFLNDIQIIYKGQKYWLQDYWFVITVRPVPSLPMPRFYPNREATWQIWLLLISLFVNILCNSPYPRTLLRTSTIISTSHLHRLEGQWIDWCDRIHLWLAISILDSSTVQHIFCQSAAATSLLNSWERVQTLVWF